ncbi:tetratricopeptide repeat protein [Saccharopolyspora sp. NPDC050642]|uniref:tetratricopeptide repeat protein n=1 Tax=Saccharopolyspora sp. NPDC050642 TaxID=3157099 RepID=UPI0034020EB3
MVQAGSVSGGIHFHQFASAEPVIPRQLPTPPAYFTNRDSELTALEQTYTSSRDRGGLAVLSGLGGVGKTAVALRWMYSAQERFADGQFYADLAAGDGGEPAAPGAVLGGWLRALGVPAEAVPADLEQRAAWWRSLVADKAIGILLDNAWTAAQVRAMLPASPRSMVLVTARRQLASLRMDGAQLVFVPPLSTGDGVRLLDRTIGDDRVRSAETEAGRLVDLCGGLPIALSVMGARLASRPRYGVAQAVAELQHERGRLRILSREEEVSVSSVFDLSYNGLPAEARRTYRTLGMHPGREMSIETVLAATDLPPAVLDEHLDALLEAHLLEEVNMGRYRLHDLLRLHAGERAREEDSSEDRATALLRIIESYIRSAEGACRLLTPHLRGADYSFTHPEVTGKVFEERAAALAWLEAECANMISCIRTAVDRRWWAAAWYLAYVMWPLFRYAGHHQERLVVDELAVRSAKELGNLEWEGRATRRLALLHNLRGQRAEADELLHRCFEVFSELGDEYGVANTRDAQSVIALAAGEHQRAVRFAEQARAGFAALGRERKAILSLLVVGQAKVASAAIGEGIALLREVQRELATSRESDPYNAARAELVLGEALVRVGDTAEAETWLSAGETAMQTIGSVEGKAFAHQAWADFYRSQGDAAAAEEHLAAAIRHFDHQGDAAADVLRRRLTDWRAQAESGPTGRA